MLLYIKELIFKKSSYDRLIDFLNCCIYLFLITSWIGFTGGSYNNHRGATVEPLCLPRNPECGIYTDGHDGYRNYIHGAEYETGSFRGYMKTVHNHDVPCVFVWFTNDLLFRCFQVSNLRSNKNKYVSCG